VTKTHQKGKKNTCYTNRKAKTTTTTPPTKRSKKPPSLKDRGRKEQPPTKTKNTHNTTIKLKTTTTRSLHKEFLDSNREVVPPSTHNEKGEPGCLPENKYHKENWIL